jgi:hypothetical protein
MREGRVWIRQRGDAATVVPVVKRFAEQVDLPVGFHWYNWHQIPYDNDYPHYFPPKEGFREGIRELQDAGIVVMPYINARLWDTRDRGMEDFEFTAKALPAACKDEAGNLYIESYESKEADGSPVRLAVMCPSTRRWEDTIVSLIDRLVNDYGVDGVYVDQVAAAPANLCFDPSHGHPLGGGHWWNDAYHDLLAEARSRIPEGTILTTESNAEPFILDFDGYLTWHWQFPNQVPAFQTVYAGMIELFGRSYRPGPTKAVTYRMKIAQQLVYGEQIGWVEDPGIVDEPETLDFIRQVGRIRTVLARYLTRGEMLRPPKVTGNVPTVRGDWRWLEEWWVEFDAFLTGAWRLPGLPAVALMAINIADEPVEAVLEIPAHEYGLTCNRLQAAALAPESRTRLTARSGNSNFDLQLPPRTAMAWELSPFSVD